MGCFTVLRFIAQHMMGIGPYFTSYHNLEAIGIGFVMATVFSLLLEWDDKLAT